jgi:hypothetical protein
MPGNFFDVDQIRRLRWLFIITLVYLAAGIVVALLIAVGEVRAGTPNLQLLAIATGVAGSAITALVSALERHSNGFEDRDGHATPDPGTAKERFSERMFFWFVMRPFLGGVVAVGVFWGVDSHGLGGTVGDSGLSATKVAFYGLLSGLFAKSMLDILRKVPKNVFGK